MIMKARKNQGIVRYTLATLGCWLVASFNVAVRASDAQEALFSWPQMDKAFSIPKLNAAGDRLAAVVEGDLQVWALTPEGKPDKLIWRSLRRSPTSYPISFDWFGNQLLLSSVESPNPLTEGLLSQLFSGEGSDKLNVMLHSHGKTSLVTPGKNQITKILDVAYGFVAGDLKGQYLAVLQPTHVEAQSGDIDFYEYRSNNGQAKLIGRYRSSVKDRPFIITWSKDSSGVYVLSKLCHRRW